MRKLTSNWDIAVASGALVLIVGGITAGHVRRLRCEGPSVSR
jgi:hypothetical protein